MRCLAERPHNTRNCAFPQFFWSSLESDKGIKSSKAIQCSRLLTCFLHLSFCLSCPNAAGICSLHSQPSKHRAREQKPVEFPFSWKQTSGTCSSSALEKLKGKAIADIFCSHEIRIKNSRGQFTPSRGIPPTPFSKWPLLRSSRICAQKRAPTPICIHFLLGYKKESTLCMKFY